MSGSNLDWGGGGGDYSFLISSIEGTISSALPSDVSPTKNYNNDSFSSLNTPNNLKRSRLSIDSADFSNISHRSFNAGYGESLKSLAECDELKIVNEQLVEQLASCKTEFKLSKDKMLRQLNYLEEQNIRYKADSESRLEKFFEEKKKWQVKIRELEHQNKQQASAFTNSSVSTTSTATAQAVLESNINITKQLKQLEKEVLSKSRELREKTHDMIELQNTVETLQHELRLNQAIHPASSSSQESEEVKELQRSLQDLEMKLKRRAREAEKLEARLKNQSKLEEELVNAGSQLKLAHERIKRFETMESSHQRLVDEKAAWRSLFQGIMQSSSSGSGQQDSAKEVTPTNVLRLLSAAQERCSVLLRAQSDLELSNTALQTKLRQAESSLKELQQSSKEAIAISAALTKRNSIMSQQIGLFDGEVQSLRSLLRTYDVEFGLGKPGTDRVVALKDEQITSLTKELDKARAAGVSLGNRVHDLETASRNHVPTTGGDQPATSSEQTQQQQQSAEAVSLLKIEVEMLKMELSALQEVTGLDFVPERTRVLHLAHNPFSMARKTPLESPVSTLPMDELKRLRQAVRKTGSAEGVETGDKSSAPPPESSEAAHNQSMDMSMINKPSSSSSASAAATTASIADAAKMNQRLKEMFKERITAFREAVYLLTGYKIDLYSAEPSTSGGSGSLPRLRLRSMYSEKADDCLLFQWKGDTLELLDTEFASRLDPKLFASLTACNSVPAFLSNVTMELFESQTFIGR